MCFILRVTDCTLTCLSWGNLLCLKTQVGTIYRFSEFSQNLSCPPALFFEQLFQAKPLQMERIIQPQSQSQSALSDHSSGLPSCCTFQEGAGPPLTHECFPKRRITLPSIGPSLFPLLPLHLLGLTTRVAHHSALLRTCS